MKLLTVGSAFVALRLGVPDSNLLKINNLSDLK